MQELIEVKKQNFTLLGKNQKIKGEFYLSGHVKVQSLIEGQIQMAPKSTLSIEREGTIRGDIECFDIEIHGQFIGNLSSKGRLILWPSAYVHGKISSKSLTIYPGAQLDTECHTDED